MTLAMVSAYYSTCWMSDSMPQADIGRKHYHF